MRKLIALLCCAMLAAPALAQDKAKKEPSEKQKAQQERMKDCNAKMGDKKGDDRKKATAKVKLADKYNEYAQKGVQFGLVKKEQANLDDYVTQKALDGLFFMVAEEEKKIRQDPVKAGSDIIKKVFGALQK